MKTPREILLERHRTITPKLNAIRRESVGRVSSLSQTFKIKGSETGWKPVLRLLWRELILPSHRIWTGLAAIWVLILAVNFSLRDNSQSTAANSLASSPEIMMTYQQQERLLAELMDSSEPQVAEPPKTFNPRPKTQRRSEILIV
jgi:hypothetical protein